MTQTTDEQQGDTQKELAHTLAITQKAGECKSTEVSAKSAVVKCDPGAGENPFARVNELITELITDLITNVTNKMQSKAS